MPGAAEITFQKVYRPVRRIEVLYAREGIVLYVLSGYAVTIQAHCLEQDGLEIMNFVSCSDDFCTRRLRSLHLVTHFYKNSKLQAVGLVAGISDAQRGTIYRERIC